MTSLPVDSFNTLAPLLALFALFTGWAFSAWGWGACGLGRIAKGMGFERILCEAAAGTLGYALLAEALGLAGAIGVRASGGFRTVAGVGFLLGLWRLRELVRARRAATPEAGDRWAALVAGILLGIVGLRLLQGFRLNPHGDPFYYDLVGARMWFDLGAIRRVDAYPIVFQSGLWDSLYLWPHELLASSPGQGLAEGQLFAQWTHSLFGFGGAGIALAALLIALGVPAGAAWLGALAGLASHQLSLGAALAKNDWGAAFWMLTGLLAVVRKQGAFAGLFIGGAFAAKLTTLLTAAPVASLLWLGSRPRDEGERRQASVPAAGFGFVAAASLILFRNFWQLGNPLFPLYQNWFPNPWMGPTRLFSYGGFQGQGLGAQLATVPRRLGELLRDGPFLVGWFAFPMLRSRLGAAGSAMRFLWAGSALAFLAFLFKITPDLELRLFGPGLLLLGGFGGAVAGALAERAPWPRLGRGGALGILLVVAAFPFHAVVQALPSRLDPPATAVLHHTAGEAKAWLRAHVGAEERILTVTDNEIYYLLPRPVIVSDYDPAFDRALRSLGSAPFENLLREFRIRYILDIGRDDTSGRLAGWVSRHPESVVFQKGSTRVLEVSP